MAELLKDIYNPAFFERFTRMLSGAIKGFSKELFLKKIYDEEWEQRPLKQRMKHIAQTMHSFLPKDYAQGIIVVEHITSYIQQHDAKASAFEYMFLPEYVEIYGGHHYELSIQAIEFITQFTSCEYAIRPFIIHYPEKAMRQMLLWSRHENHSVRRLSSEGCRPRLPWAMALPALKKDPAFILPILENLKNDPSEYVRRSVANNLNDIAKDHPSAVLNIIKSWKGQTKNTDWIIKHGSRTLLKKANEEALSLFGHVAKKESLSVSRLQLASSNIFVGDDLRFSFQFSVIKNIPVKLRIEYAIDYVKANGKTNRKIFKLKEHLYEPGQIYKFRRYQSFRNLTTRKHYPGKHRIGIIINGQQLAEKDFSVRE